MINLTQDICEELDLVYWQSSNTSELTSQDTVLVIAREEKELLRKILLAKGVRLDGDMLTLKPEGVVEIQLTKLKLIFDGQDSITLPQVLHLSRLSDMLRDASYKKITWNKLKNIML